jgi:predicted permease
MVIVGSLLASYPARDMVRDRSVFVISAVRLVAIPIGVWFVLQALPVGDLVANVVVTLAAMPAAVNCVLFACEYGSHPNLASRLVFVSTLCSVLTIPLVALLFH